MKKLELLQDISKYWNGKPKKQFIPGKSLIPPSAPSINSDDIVTIADALLDGWFTEGKYHRLFSRELLGQISMLNCLLCNSGSSASLLAILAVAELTPRKRFIVTCASGFPTTVSPIYQADKIPIYIDIDPANLSPDFVQLEDVVKKYGKDIAGVIFTHTLGIPHDESGVRDIIGDEIYYIVDCCDALGAKVRGRDGFFFPVGVEADIATLSFFPAHQICTGEGGAVLSSSFEIMDIMKSLSSWGRSCYCLPGQNNTCGQRFCWKERGTLPEGYDHKYIFSRLGYNLKMTELQAAMGLSQMYRLNEFTNARMKNYTYLFEGLAQYIEYLQLVIFPLDSIPSPFGFPVIVRDVAPFTARELIEHLEANKVGTRRIFAGNLKRQPAFMGQSYMTKETPNSDYLMESAFLVGCHPSLTKEMLDYMIGVFEEFINGRE